MAIHPCPSCDKKMRTPDDAEGKKLRCPHCQSMLVVAEDGLEVFGRTGSSAKETVKSSRRTADEEEEEDRPVRKRRYEDEDDEDEDRPRRRRRDDEEDEEDDEDRPRPRRKKKKKRSSGGIPMWVWFAVGGGLLAAVGIAVVFIFVLKGSGSNFGKVKEGMTVAEVKELLGPPMEEGIFGGNGSAVWTHPAVKKEEIVSGKGGNIKEMLLVVFLNGKVASSQHIKDIKAGGGIPNFGGGGSANPFRRR